MQNAEKQRSVVSLVFHLYCRRMRLSAKAIQTYQKMSRTFFYSSDIFIIAGTSLAVGSSTQIRDF